MLTERVDGNAYFLYGLPKLVFGDAEFARPIFELVSLIDVHASAVLRAAVIEIVRHDSSFEKVEARQVSKWRARESWILGSEL